VAASADGMAKKGRNEPQATAGNDRCTIPADEQVRDNRGFMESNSPVAGHTPQALAIPWVSMAWRCSILKQKPQKGAHLRQRSTLVVTSNGSRRPPKNRRYGHPKPAKNLGSLARKLCWSSRISLSAHTPTLTPPLLLPFQRTRPVGHPFRSQTNGQACAEACSSSQARPRTLAIPADPGAGIRVLQSSQHRLHLDW
jgi:hypothetical protein